MKKHHNPRQSRPSKPSFSQGSTPRNGLEMLYGVIPVCQALKIKRRKIVRLIVKTEQSPSPRILEIIHLAKEHSVPVEFLEKSGIDSLCPEGVHQGILLECGPLPYVPYEALAPEDGLPNPVIVALDQVEDPHNLGAIIRSCGFFNVLCVVVPASHSSGITAVVSKTSAGVAESFPIVQVPNLNRFLEMQKTKNFWIAGLDGAAEQDISTLPGDVPLVLVLGNEGQGLRQLVKSKCDWLVKIPGNPDIAALNVSNAAAIALYQLRQLKKRS
ncbi:MAG: 23S rRNA (guanosine(2251)-2'-O)-methyltransferase RlmB [SAR324 cluster bacterium]|nr:23S rRNA (guanosine(2251)-2'-O)-methyltransferase RlmB [SAR324 cluster bacterium]